MPKAPDQPRFGKVVMISARFGRPKELAGGPRLLNDEEVQGLQLKTISSPRLTVYDRQLANITISNQKTYVRAFDRDGKKILGNVTEGIVLEAQPTIAADEKSVTIALRYIAAELKPMRQLETARGRIDVPELVKLETALTVELGNGRLVSIALPGVDGVAPLELEDFSEQTPDCPNLYPFGDISFG